MCAAKNAKTPPQQPRAGYWHETRRPLVCLAFIAPMLLIYEGGVWVLGAHATRNGVDVYLRNFLTLLGFGQYFLLPVLTTFILLAWHHTTGQPWRIRSRIFGGMFAESVALGLMLLLLGQLHFAMVTSTSAAVPCAAGSDSGSGRLIAFLGAGIYEELFFRLMLLPVTAAVIRCCGGSRRTSIIAAIIITSLVFSAAHYKVFTFNDGADDLRLFSFTFRFLAGVFFSVLFLYRGFGVAAASHALYDIFIELNAWR